MKLNALAMDEAIMATNPLAASSKRIFAIYRR
jgi:hypothetical protein